MCVDTVDGHRRAGTPLPHIRGLVSRDAVDAVDANVRRQKPLARVGRPWPHLETAGFTQDAGDPTLRVAVLGPTSRAGVTVFGVRTRCRARVELASKRVALPCTRSVTETRNFARFFARIYSDPKRLEPEPFLRFREPNGAPAPDAPPAHTCGSRCETFHTCDLSRARARRAWLESARPWPYPMHCAPGAVGSGAWSLPRRPTPDASPRCTGPSLRSARPPTAPNAPPATSNTSPRTARSIGRSSRPPRVTASRVRRGCVTRWRPSARSWRSSTAGDVGRGVVRRAAHRARPRG